MKTSNIKSLKGFSLFGEFKIINNLFYHPLPRGGINETVDFNSLNGERKKIFHRF
jgi:hypothetical protein